MSKNTQKRRKEVKAMRDALGRQGIELDTSNLGENTVEAPNNLSGIKRATVVVQESAGFEDMPLEDGWQVGFDVHYNGVGFQRQENGCVTSQEGSSGFSSDTPSDGESEESSSASAEGVILHGYKRIGQQGPDFYVSRDFTARPVKIKNVESEDGKVELSTTKRFPVKLQQKKNSAGYQQVDLDESKEQVQEPLLEPCSSCLWNRTLFIAPKEEVLEETEKMEIDEIKKTMKALSFLPPPGWEHIDDSKLLGLLENLKK